MNKSQLIERIVSLEKQLKAANSSKTKQEGQISEWDQGCRDVLFDLHEDIIIIDRNYKIVDINASALITSGHLREEVIGQYCYEIFHGYHESCDQHGEQCHLKEVFKTEKSINCQHEHACADGSSISMDILISPIKNKQGQVTHVIEIMRDISNFLEVKKEVLFQGKKAQQYLDVVGVMIVAIDVNQKVKLINRKGCEILGYPEDEVVGKNWIECFLPQKNVKQVKSVFKQIISGKLEPVEYYENPVLTKSGQERIIAWHNSILYDENGKITGTLSSGNDITERKYAEQSLRDSEIRFRALTTSAPVGIFQADVKGNGVFVNEAVCLFTGLSYEACLGSGWTAAVHPDDKNRVLRLWKDTVAGKASFDTELRFINTKKEIIWLTSHVASLMDSDGTVVGFIGTLTEITELKQTEKLLYEKQQFIESILSLSPDVFYIYDLIEQKNIYSNGGIQLILGYNVKEIQTMGDQVMSTLMHPDDFKIYFKETFPKYAHAKDNEFISYQYRMKDKNGHWHWLDCREIVYLRLPDGSPKQIFGVVHDVTERVIAEKKLDKTFKRNEAILAAVPDIIMEVNKNKIYTWVNQEGVKFFGDDVIGKEASHYFNGEQDTYKIVQPLFEGSDDITYVESWQRRKDGEKRLLAWWCRNLKNEQGEIAGALSSARDITEQRNAEEQIVQDLREKELLLKEIHHRVKNNLQIIISLLNLQAHQIKEPRILDVIKDSKNRIYSMALVHQKLYESNDFTNIDFKIYMKGIIRELSYALDIKDQIKINVDVADVALGIDLAVPCGLIINELVTNAMKHAFPDRKNGIINISLKNLNNNYLELGIRDNGVGLEGKINLKKIKTLGLQLVRILVDQIDGKIQIINDSGLDFRIRFRNLNPK
ncbi:PAS domain S-box protein [bacterium]